METQLSYEDLVSLVNHYKTKAEQNELNNAVLQGRLDRAEKQIAELTAEENVEAEATTEAPDDTA